MRHAVAYSILFCLVFLNAPKDWLHDCEYHVAQDNDSEIVLDHFDNDPCFVCDFDLGFYNLQTSIFVSNLLPVSERITELVVRQRSTDPIHQKPLRGPPSV